MDAVRDGRGELAQEVCVRPARESAVLPAALCVCVQCEVCGVSGGGWCGVMCEVCVSGAVCLRVWCVCCVL